MANKTGLAVKAKVTQVISKVAAPVAVKVAAAPLPVHVVAPVHA